MSATYQGTLSPFPSRRDYAGAVARFISCWWRSYIVWRNQQLAIAALQRLDNRLLNDIGIDHSEIRSVVRAGGKERNPKFHRCRTELKCL